LGTTPGFWLNLQTRYDLATANLDPAEVAAIHPLVA
jgi:plasmid maintenance system antidote protein VapI